MIRVTSFFTTYLQVTLIEINRVAGAVKKVHVFPLSGLLVIRLFSVRSFSRNWLKLCSLQHQVASVPTGSKNKSKIEQKVGPQTPNGDPLSGMIDSPLCCCRFQ